MTRVVLARVLQTMVVVSFILSVGATIIVAALGYELLLADPPETFQILPVRLASNPTESAAWDFNDPRPTLQPGDQLIGDFHVCFSNALGGPGLINVQSRRFLVSFDGSVRAPLSTADMSFLPGCRATHSVIGVIPPQFPSGTYRVVGSTIASTAHYSRVVDWASVWFDVAQ